MPKFYNIFSGTFFEIPEEYVTHMDCGDVPISQFPKHNCKKCLGRGYEFQDKKTLHFKMCRCVLKQIDQSRIVHKEVHDIPMNYKYEKDLI